MKRFLCIALMFVSTLANAGEIVITFGGDVNFSRSRVAPQIGKVTKTGTVDLAKTTSTLAGEWNGDVNFVNVETVVSHRSLSGQGKTFVFRSHPSQFRHLMKLGVNAFSLANNHAYDYGRAGMADTLAFFERNDRPDSPLLFAGVGIGQDAYAPKVITVKGVRIALSSVSFGSGSFSPTDSAVGMAHYTDEAQYSRVLSALGAAEAEIKILSIHYGTENQTTLNSGQRKKFLRAVDDAGVNLVLGHHPHVVRAVEVLPESQAAVFYSLGNFLFIGGAAKDSSRLGEDYGLMGRAYFNVNKGKAQLTALEAIPLKGVHFIPRRPPPSRAEALIDHLNRLSRRGLGQTAASFEVISPDAPRGLMCLNTGFGPRARKLCCSGSSAASCSLPDLM